MRIGLYILNILWEQKCVARRTKENRVLNISYTFSLLLSIHTALSRWLLSNCKEGWTARIYSWPSPSSGGSNKLTLLALSFPSLCWQTTVISRWSFQCRPLPLLHCFPVWPRIKKMIHLFISKTSAAVSDIKCYYVDCARLCTILSCWEHCV